MLNLKCHYFCIQATPNFTSLADLLRKREKGEREKERVRARERERVSRLETPTRNGLNAQGLNLQCPYLRLHNVFVFVNVLISVFCI